MATDRVAPQTFPIGPDTLLAYLRAQLLENSEREDDAHPQQSGSWEAVTRFALASSVTFGPHPEQWRLASLRFTAGAGAAMQPLLRRFAFFIALARTVRRRHETEAR
jgi:hypothetical protein